jgi:hypothetical protein
MNAPWLGHGYTLSPESRRFNYEWHVKVSNKPNLIKANAEMWVERDEALLGDFRKRRGPEIERYLLKQLEVSKQIMSTENEDFWCDSSSFTELARAINITSGSLS